MLPRGVHRRLQIVSATRVAGNEHGVLESRRSKRNFLPSVLRFQCLPSSPPVSSN